MWKVLILSLFVFAFPCRQENQVVADNHGRYIVTLKKSSKVADFLESVISVMDLKSPAFRLLYRYDKIVNGFAAKISDETLEKLREYEVVECIEEDKIFSASQTEVPWGLDRIDQISLPLDGVYSPIGTGSGVNVYIMDSGIYAEHNDFEGRAEATDFDPFGEDGRDCNGHGSFCAGVVGGATYGVAKGASLKGVRVLNCNGDGYTSEILAGFEWIISSAEMPAVVSASFSGDRSEALNQAISDLVEAGITVVGSAGNDASDACLYSPGESAKCITVSAMDDKDTRATTFANYGSCVDLFAPGVGIKSVWIGDTDATNTLSGCSVATPFVAGAAAILLSQNNTLTPEQVKLRLESRAVMETVKNAGFDSPDRVLYIGEGDGPNVPPHAEACSETIMEDGSIITSPNYPNNYGNNEECEYQITAGQDYVISLTFDTFDIEDGSTCQYDALEVYDSSSAVTSYKIGTYCGRTNPGSIVSTGNAMYLKFTSDDVETGQGFSANVAFIQLAAECSCPGTCDDDNPQFNSPNYPDDYINGDRCEYQFNVPEGNGVQIEWINFNVEQSVLGGCFDSVTVYDGGDDSFPIIAELCGTSLPDPVTSSSNTIFLVFESDSSVTRSGFLGTYAAKSLNPPPSTLPPPTTSATANPPETTVNTPSEEPTQRPDCGGNYNDEDLFVTSPRFPANYPRNQDCGNTITAPSNHQIEFTFLTMDIEYEQNCGFDSVQLFDGSEMNEARNLSVPLCGTLDELDQPYQYFSTENTMYVYFKSDGTVQRTGFNATFRFISEL